MGVVETGAERKYRGYIITKEKNRPKLERLGIRLGAYVSDRFTDCVVGKAALSLISPYYGHGYSWHLT